MKEEKRDMVEIIRNAHPSEVGGIFMKIIGAKEAAERRKRMKFRNERRRFGKEHELLSFAIFLRNRGKFCFVWEWLFFWAGGKTS